MISFLLHSTIWPLHRKLTIHFFLLPKENFLLTLYIWRKKTAKKRITSNNIWTGAVSVNYGSEAWDSRAQPKGFSIEKEKTCDSAIDSSCIVRCVHIKAHKRTYCFDFRFGFDHFPIYSCVQQHWCYLKNVWIVFCHFRNKTNKNYWWLPIFNVTIVWPVSSNRKSQNIRMVCPE